MFRTFRKVIIPTLLILLFGGVFLFVGCDKTEKSSVDKLTIKFAALNGAEVADLEITADKEIALPSPTREGYDFSGWYLEESCQTAATAEGLKAKISEGEITLYAKWTEKTILLSFETVGGGALANERVGYTAVEGSLLPEPIKTGYKFARWYFDENYQTPYTAAALKERFSSGNVMLYAKWGIVMRSDTVTIQGKSENKTLPNPTFDWTDADHDGEFFVRLTDAEGVVVEEGQVVGTHFELSENLSYGKTYDLEITGIMSDSYRSLRFETVQGTGALDLTTAQFSVAEPFKSHMVIQRGEPVTITGKTAANVQVAIDYYGKTYYTRTDGQGVYTFLFPAMAANATPTDIEIRILKDRKITIADVVVGDVYLVSGQSNVQRTLEECTISGKAPEWSSDVTDAITYGVRYYHQAENAVSAPVDNTVGSYWFKAETNGNYKKYSAVAFMVGAMLGKELAAENVPVGIVYAAKGNTNIVSWIGKDYFDGPNTNKNKHYNGMIYPLRNAEFKGVVWYQGCNNSASGADYKGYLQSLIANWRELFGKEEMPFYVVQLPCYNGDRGNNYDFSYVRESQYKVCQSDDNAYLIATCDGGDPEDIHPKEKRYICERLTKSILSTLYGADYLPQGPTYLSHEISGSSAIITVENGEGLTATGEIVGYMLAGADGKYYDATARIENGKIVVTSDKVSSPVYIKYGFSKCPFLNVYNKDGYLMSPFRTDENNHNIDLLDYRESATESVNTKGSVYSYNPGGSEMTVAIVDVDGEAALRVTKVADNKGYGILELAKWGAIGYDEHLLKLRIKGSGSGAQLVFRIVEGSYETWATPELTDDFTTVREIFLPFSYLSVSSEGNGIIDLQAVWRVELVIKGAEKAVTVDVLEAKFVDFERSAPADFAIKEARNDGHDVTIKYGFSDFATSYRVIVSADGTDFTSPIYDEGTEAIKITFDPSLCVKGVTYYVKVIAINELGETVATNSGFLMGSVDRYVISDLTFASDDALNSYKASNMVVNSKLAIARAEKGIKINVKEKDGWLNCIFKITDGANIGYDTLKFYIDLSEYKGSEIKIQLQTKDGIKSYTDSLKYGDKRTGYFEIPLSSFRNGEEAFNAANKFERIAFNFIDYAGGENDNVYLADLELIKAA